MNEETKPAYTLVYRRYGMEMRMSCSTLELAEESAAELRFGKEPLRIEHDGETVKSYEKKEE